MKIAVTGKGGVGKTTIAGFLIWHFASDGSKIIEFLFFDSQIKEADLSKEPLISFESKLREDMKMIKGKLGE